MLISEFYVSDGYRAEEEFFTILYRHYVPTGIVNERKLLPQLKNYRSFSHKIEDAICFVEFNGLFMVIEFIIYRI